MRNYLQFFADFALFALLVAFLVAPLAFFVFAIFPVPLFGLARARPAPHEWGPLSSLLTTIIAVRAAKYARKSITKLWLNLLVGKSQKVVGRTAETQRKVAHESRFRLVYALLPEYHGALVYAHRLGKFFLAHLVCQPQLFYSLGDYHKNII